MVAGKVWVFIFFIWFMAITNSVWGLDRWNQRNNVVSSGACTLEQECHIMMKLMTSNMPGLTGPILINFI